MKTLEIVLCSWLLAFASLAYAKTDKKPVTVDCLKFPTALNCRNGVVKRSAEELPELMLALDPDEALYVEDPESADMSDSKAAETYIPSELSEIPETESYLMKKRKRTFFSKYKPASLPRVPVYQGHPIYFNRIKLRRNNHRI